MIKYALQCDDGHEFEAWFQNSQAYDKLVKRGQVECAICGTSHVTKAIMAPNIATKGNISRGRNFSAEEKAKAYYTVMARQVKEYVEQNFDNVGQDFAEEARKIHYGESEERGIYGEAALVDAQELIEEGIDVLPLLNDGEKKAN